MEMLCGEVELSVPSSGNYSGPLSSEQLQDPRSHGFSEQVLKGRSSKTCPSKSKECPLILKTADLRSAGL